MCVYTKLQGPVTAKLSLLIGFAKVCWALCKNGMDILYYYRTTHHADDEQKISIFFILFRPHRMHSIDSTYFYRCWTFRGVCLCAGPTGEPCKNEWTDRYAVWEQSRVGPRGMHIGVTWSIRLNDSCAAAMRPYVKLLWPIVCACHAFERSCVS